MKEYVLKNDFLEVHFVNYGASITKLIDLKTKRNLVLAYDDMELYKYNPNYFGCVVGRNAGRIENSLLKIYDKRYLLSRNFLDKHQLHSGENGFHQKYFTEKIGNDYIKFTAISHNGEDGFPGNVTLTVTYRLVKNELHLEYEAKSDQMTIINLTNHNYFNLNQDKTKSIENHHLVLNCDHYIELDEEMIPKKVKSVDNTVLDFRKGKLIGKDINNDALKLTGGYDHPFIINKNDLNFVASINNEDIKLDVYSNQDAVIFYSGNFLEGDAFRTGLCLETQGIPNSANIENYETKNIYQKDELYYQHTIWKVINL